MKGIYYTLLTIVLCLGIYFLYQKNVINSSPLEKEVIDLRAKDRKEIKENLEKGFFNLTSEVYNSRSPDPQDIPFYDLNLTKFAMVNYMRQYINTLSLMSGKQENFTWSMNPKNIIVNSFSKDAEQANISYDLIIISMKDTTIGHIDCDAKKIGGQWKIDGKPITQETKTDKTTKHKNH